MPCRVGSAANSLENTTSQPTVAGYAPRLGVALLGAAVSRRVSPAALRGERKGKPLGGCALDTRSWQVGWTLGTARHPCRT